MAEIVDSADSAMEANVKNGDFRIRKVRLAQRGFAYDTFELTGYVAGERVRRRFKSRDLATGEKTRLEVAAANTSGQVRPVLTRLADDQVRTAETLFALTPDPLAAVNWYLANYRAPVVSVLIEFASTEFMRDREREVSVAVVVDYRKVTKLLVTKFPKRSVDSITTEEIETVMGTWGQSKKSWNNLRTYLHAFFEFCAHASRRWVASNPVKPIRKYEIARGIPDILSAEKVGEMFAFLETYSGPARSGHKPGYLVPYFALATFAGIRPSVRDGEIRKIHEFADKEKLIDPAVGVIRITPEIAKTNDLRQVTIQRNLARWLQRYPIATHPLIVRNAMDHVGIVRRKFGLTADVLRHTFISMFVAKFKSLGAAALESGNSERIIKKHYLNRVTDAVADAFWAICPQ